MIKQYLNPVRILNERSIDVQGIFPVTTIIHENSINIFFFLTLAIRIRVSCVLYITLVRYTVFTKADAERVFDVSILKIKESQWNIDKNSFFFSTTHEPVSLVPKSATFPRKFYTPEESKTTLFFYFRRRKRRSTT